MPVTKELAQAGGCRVTYDRRQMASGRLFELLTAYHSDGAFNQYRDVHPELDLPNGAAVRCQPRPNRPLRPWIGIFG